ncbi:hypothetical protein AB833_04575 [Chromatiales bacterium (ex Bugula neritina AB1)]|nr:hypothetical protein AB833_04575 [Chromatiales bacterium (ex Bugula neritina AB1)]
MLNEKIDLQELVSLVSGREAPPVASWNPSVQRTIDMRIDRSGGWFYNGSSIKRERMVALFSTILRREADGYYLVTPGEKLRITVDDVPFIALLMDVTGEGVGQNLRFTDNVGNVFCADHEHPLWLQSKGEQTIPYVMVRDQLPARLAIPVYYQLADYVSFHNGVTGVWSSGEFFPLSGDKL